MTTEAPDRIPWHLDRKVPMAIIIALLTQAGAFIWWASGMQSGLEGVRTNDVRIETRVGKLEDDRPLLLQRMTAVETQLASQNTLLAQILAELRQK